MYKYTVEGLAERDDAVSTEASAEAGPSGSSAEAAERPIALQPPHDARSYSYSLKGIVVHSGSAFAGHYYSYIKVQPT